MAIVLKAERLSLKFIEDGICRITSLVRGRLWDSQRVWKRKRS